MLLHSCPNKRPFSPSLVNARFLKSACLTKLGHCIGHLFARRGGGGISRNAHNRVSRAILFVGGAYSRNDRRRHRRHRRSRNHAQAQVLPQTQTERSLPHQVGSSNVSKIWPDSCMPLLKGMLLLMGSINVNEKFPCGIVDACAQLRKCHYLCMSLLECH